MSTDTDTNQYLDKSMDMACAVCLDANIKIVSITQRGYSCDIIMICKSNHKVLLNIRNISGGGVVIKWTDLFKKENIWEN